ncbi:CPBP family glutamic-type intramembrane protease [Synechococcus elongatus]|uniref:CPBP family glutamic-type intramembrane protease n=1 Tax=Synechococcus elongatus PCC 11801 TaxID=2219813 RepID=A0AAN1UTE1_SYNEL|nr:CPBP family glutamic-type intramembrane protease [Synechococcus elongatus]AZB71431.1 CPBP family intramembrane metalloprotease [Synechococcus elongatus PCC 11801]
MGQPVDAAISWRLHLLLWLLGMMGVLSLLLLPLPPLGEAPIPPMALRVLVLIQPTILLTIAVLIGARLAPAVGLQAPAVVACSNRQNGWSLLQPQLWPALLAGLLSGVLLWAIAGVGQFLLPLELASMAAPPLLLRFLYGGITEEILLRWGLMTLLLWLGWRWGQRRQGLPQKRWVAIAIALSAFVFAAAHLPYAAAIGLPLTPVLTGYLLLQNGLFGLVAGYLYWRYGLEAAIVAHWVVHLALAILQG